MRHGAEYLARELVGGARLEPEVRNNLEALTKFRDTAVYFYHRSGAPACLVTLTIAPLVSSTACSAL
jgi:hypothetical protein